MRINSLILQGPYLKSDSQADGYKVIIQNDECQEWHAKVLCSFT